MALPKRQRIRKGEDFNRIFREGKVLRNNLFLARVLKNTLPYGRASIVVSRSVCPKAAKRSFLKRLIVENLKNFLLQYHLDMIFIVRPQVKGKNFKEINCSLKEIFLKANIV